MSRCVYTVNRAELRFFPEHAYEASSSDVYTRDCGKRSHQSAWVDNVMRASP